MEREGFIFYQSFWNATKHLPSENQKNALVFIVQYGIDGIEPNKEIDPIAYAIFLMSKPQLDTNNKRYIDGCKGGGFGNLGGRPKSKFKSNKTITNPTGVSDNNPKRTPNDNDNDNDNVKEKVKRKTKKIVASFDEFIELVKGVDRAREFPSKNIEIEQKRCWAKLGGKMKDAKATFKNWLLPHKRDKEYIEGIKEKTDDQWISEFLGGKNLFNEKYGRDKYQEVKDKWVKKCLSQPLSL